MEATATQLKAKYPTAPTGKRLTNARKIAKRLVRHYFKDDYGNPFVMSDGQADIFLCIFLRLYPRNNLMTYTQYGKSTVVAMALIMRSHFFNEPWVVVAGSEDKAMIIMEKVIQHIFDNQRFMDALSVPPGETLLRLKVKRRSDRLDWIGGGGIRIYTGNAKNRKAVKEALTGLGNPNVVVEEAALLPDDLMAMILRMLGGHTQSKSGTFLLKIGNAVYPNHFKRSANNPAYYRIVVDYKQGIAEGRITEDFVDEVRNEPFFAEMYECKFPDDSAILEGGYRKLVTDEMIEQAWVDDIDPIGEPKLGIDVAAGGQNLTAFVIRYDNVAFLLEKNRDPDLMAQVGKAIRFMEEYKIDSSGVYVDDNGVGGGVTSRLIELGYGVNGVKEGARATEPKKYANVKAEIFWLLREWLLNGGKLKRNSDFLQLGVINYKEDSTSRLKTEPKSDLQKRGIASPDVADALALTFDNTPVLSGSDFDII